MRLIDTIENEKWLRENEPKIHALLPEIWTLIDNLNGAPVMKIAFGFKVLGIDWRTMDEFGCIMLFLEKLSILERQNGYQVRANPSSVFK